MKSVRGGHDGCNHGPEVHQADRLHRRTLQECDRERPRLRGDGQGFVRQGQRERRYSKDPEEECTEQFDSQSNETSQFYVGEGVCETDPQEWYKKLTDDVGNIAPLGRGTEIAPQFELMTKKNFRRSTTSRRKRHTCSCCSQMPTASLTLTQSSQVSSQDVREGILDGSVMIYKVRRRENNNATGTIGDQRYA